KALTTQDAALAIQARLGIGEAGMNLGQFERVVLALEPATKMEIKPVQAAIAWFWLGQSYFQLQKLDRAEDAYRRVIRDYPNADIADSAWLGFGLCAQRLGRP